MTFLRLIFVLLIMNISFVLAGDGSSGVTLEKAILGSWETCFTYENGDIQHLEEVERFVIKFDKNGTAEMLNSKSIYGDFEEVLHYRIDGNQLFVDGDSLTAKVRSDTLIVVEDSDAVYFVKVR